MVMKQFKINFLSEMYVLKGNGCCLTDCVTKLTLACIRTLMNRFTPNLVSDDRSYCTQHFDTSVSDLDLDSKSREIRVDHAIKSTMELDGISMLLRLFGLVTSDSIYILRSIFKRENPTCIIAYCKEKLRNKELWLAFEYLQTNFFQISHDVRHQ